MSHFMGDDSNTIIFFEECPDDQEIFQIVVWHTMTDMEESHTSNSSKIQFVFHAGLCVPYFAVVGSLEDKGIPRGTDSGFPVANGSHYN